MSGAPIPLDRVEQAMAAYRAGEPVKVLSWQCGMAEKTFQRWRLFLGVERRGRIKKPKPLPIPRPRKFDRAEIRTWHARGLSDADIANLLGAHRTTVRDARGRLGLAPNFPKGFPQDNHYVKGHRATVFGLALMLLGGSTAAFCHDWYGGLTEPDKPGISCCGGQDCGPATYCQPDGGGVGLTVRGQCFKIDMATVLSMSSPDGQPHACMAPHDTKPRCVVLGGSS